MTEREHHRVAVLRADQHALREAAAWIEQAPAIGRVAALSEPHVAEAGSQLLEHLAEHLDTLPLQVRDHTVRVAREMTGAPMDQPNRRRTRRR